MEARPLWTGETPESHSRPKNRSTFLRRRLPWIVARRAALHSNGDHSVRVRIRRCDRRGTGANPVGPPSLSQLLVVVYQSAFDIVNVAERVRIPSTNPIPSLTRTPLTGASEPARLQSGVRWVRSPQRRPFFRIKASLVQQQDVGLPNRKRRGSTGTTHQFQTGRSVAQLVERPTYTR